MQKARAKKEMEKNKSLTATVYRQISRNVGKSRNVGR